MEQKIIGIILAGGIGKRLYPLSIPEKPKQLLKLFSNKTLIEDAADLISDLTDRIYISTNKELYLVMKNKIKYDFIVEPAQRNTGPAITYCATKFNKDDILIFLPSDHYIHEKELFKKVIIKAIKQAKENNLVIIGIIPRYPSTNYGYIYSKDKKNVINFKEKPNIEKAKQYIKDKNYYWNAGYIIAKSSKILSLIKKNEPKIYYSIINNEFNKCPSIPFDKAVLEKSHNIKIQIFPGYWSDIGSYELLYETLQKFKTKNKNIIVKKDHIIIDNKYILTRDKIQIKQNE